MKPWLRLTLVAVTVGGGFTGVAITLQALLAAHGQPLAYSVLTLGFLVLFAFVTVSGLVFVHDPKRIQLLIVALASASKPATMKTKATIIISTLVTLAVANSALAHPGSGIAVDREGQIYFTQTNGKGTWKVSPKGELTLISAVRDHWLDIDLEGRFSRSNLKGFDRITPDGTKPTILLNGDYPFTVNRDGNIYSALWRPGRLEINRQSPDGKVSAVQLDGATNAAIGGITGMASGPDGSLFVTDGSMLLKVTMPGRVSTVVAKVVVSDCLDDLPAPHLRGVPAGPFLRGLAVDSEGAVYAAANRCRAVLKITPDGKVTPILRATAPWSPTGVAVADGVVYVQEYDFPEAGPQQYEQRPRVRRIGRDGKVTTLAIVGEK